MWLRTSSHFSDLFKKEFGCTPLQYRYKWQKYNF
ncbi:MAG: AraC family transcriptional regulator [Coprobacillus cateniformis]